MSSMGPSRLDTEDNSLITLFLSKFMSREHVEQLGVITGVSGKFGYGGNVITSVRKFYGVAMRPQPIS
ncbi:hypothetical protein TcasGA2_TC003897 [Tribolium castaneum]|uniref:Uncharacterized protein n=1 Tax=Tribolium castaneum TaxID=7070 RepID=D6WH80_TRICA|nr:hypothetical protein TcasGA2_TC003897 [Tribolium castaneum]